jgi:hypothetical protein
MFLSLNGQAVNVPAKHINAILTNDHDGEAPSLLDLFLESWNYLNIRTPGSPGWMVFFEYRHGRARIAGLGAEA